MRGNMTTFTIRDGEGESCDVTVCFLHSLEMSPVDGVRITAAPADPDLHCEFCRDDEITDAEERMEGAR